MSEEKRKPIILISAMNTDTKSVTAAVASVRAAGAEPMLIANHAARLMGKIDNNTIKEAAIADLSKADGVLVMGNNADIDPKDYKAASKHAATKSERDTPEGAVRAAYEYNLLAETLNCKKPLLTVCGGMQRLNVLLGGTLNQHVPDSLGNESHQQDKQNIAPFVPVIYVETEANTKLSAMAGGKGLFTPSHDVPASVTMENSFHHQAIDAVGQGLRVAAHSREADPKKNIIEAIEGDPNVFKDQFVMGVQWHPEFGASELSGKLLQNLVQESERYAAMNPRIPESLRETAISAIAPTWQERVRAQQQAKQSTKDGRGAA
ncbi:MAG: gamma-glutamyl-gamma-aminobutyrate hydrolase family protein [Alphaproteobacteria bacterium]